MASDELCLCVDLGTGGPKIGVVTLDGELICHEIHHVTTHFAPDGTAEQDAVEWWELCRAASKRLIEDPKVDATKIKVIAVTGQYASTVPVDATGTPTGPCVMWLDTRGGRYSRRAVGGRLQGYNARKLRRFIRRTGGAPSPSGADPVGQILFLMNERREICEKTTWFLEPVDYLTMRFSGVASGSLASRLAMWMTDNRSLDVLQYDESLLGAVGLTSSYLPPLVGTASILGPVARDVATELGLSSDVVVLAGLPDLHAAAFGSHATQPFAAHVALSTTSWISFPVTTKKTDIFHSIAAVPGLTNDSYIVIDNQETGAKALEWLQLVLAANGEPMSYASMTALAATSPPGANGVRFSPWLAGERSPVDDKRARAGFRNLSVTTTSADMIRAVMEGVVANSAWLLRYVEKYAGQRLSPLRLVGGGAQSELWCQMYADTTNREVHQVKEPMTAQLRGMALAASVSMGRRTLRELDDLALDVKVLLPNPDLTTIYERGVDDLVAWHANDKRWRRERRRR